MKGMALVAAQAAHAFVEAHGKPSLPLSEEFVAESEGRRFTVEMPMTPEDRRVTYGELARRHAIPGARRLAALVQKQDGFAPIELPKSFECGRHVENEVSIRVVLDWPVMRLDVMTVRAHK